jgi:glycosyltransferase involved in cell wall biosynthesis
VEDVRTHMSNSTLGIVPYRIASGIRLKILESMAMKLPLVSTSIGCEGLDVVDGEHILIADTPKTFAWKVIRLLKDEDLRNRLADNAFKLVKKKYSWGNAVQKLEQIYKRYII